MPGVPGHNLAVNGLWLEPDRQTRLPAAAQAALPNGTDRDRDPALHGKISGIIQDTGVDMKGNASIYLDRRCSLQNVLPFHRQLFQFPLQRCHLLTESHSLFLPFSGLFLQGNLAGDVLGFCPKPLCSRDGERKGKMGRGKAKQRQTDVHPAETTALSSLSACVCQALSPQRLQS